MSSLDHDEPTTGIDPLQALGKQLPWHRPDDARREAVRSSLLVAAHETAPHKPRRFALVGAGFVAGALAAAAIAVLVLRAPSTSSQPERYAQIVSSTAAALEHTRVATATGSDELVRVRAGTVRFAVPAVRAGDRVRVKTGDAEVEGTGAYEVVVAADALASVRVTEGTAKVIVDGQRAVFLSAGQVWTAPIVTASLEVAPPPSADAVAPSARVTDAVAPAPREPVVVAPSTPRAEPVVSPPTVVTPRATTPPTRPSPASSTSPIAAPPVDEPAITAARPSVTTTVAAPASAIDRHFRAGWALLRENKYVEAADELARAAAGEGPLAADARYFQAIALTKARRAREAEAALVAFLDAAPTSTRRGRAAVMLGRLLVERGDTTSARAWFTSALSDTDPSVVGAAKAGISALGP